MQHVCCIFNLAAIYRAPIFQLMDRELNCSFYIGDRIATPMKTMDYTSLKGFKSVLKYIPLLANVYWQRGAVKLIFKPYNRYIVTGEIRCLSTWLILVLAIVFRKKVYLWSHGWYGREGIIKRIIKTIFFKLAHHVLLYGDYAKELMIKEGFKASTLSTIHNSLDYDKQLEIRKNLKETPVFSDHFANHNPVLFYIGRLQKTKRLDLLIEALSLLKAKEVNCNLVIVGKDIDDLGLPKLAEQYNVHHQVWFYGPLYDENEIGNFLYNAHVCVSPGNVGLTAIHSLSFGCPVITHKDFTFQGPEFEIIESGVTGEFFERDNVIDLVDTIKHWLEKDSSRSKVRHSCYQVIDQKYNPYAQLKVLKAALSL